MAAGKGSASPVEKKLQVSGSCEVVTTNVRKKQVVVVFHDFLLWWMEGSIQ